MSGEKGDNESTERCDGSRRTVVFLHAHPDDEAIFTGGTLAELRARGVPTVVVFGTCGAADPDSALADVRMAEAQAACAALGAAAVFLGFGDSGLYGESPHPSALVAAPLADVCAAVRSVLGEYDASALVTYDEGGIYGHPDHLVVHRVGTALLAAGDVPTVYECTVDREYLHFVETHLVGHAVNSLLGDTIGATNRAPLGVPTVEVSLTIDARPHHATKRAAMAAHPSQIPPDSEVLTMPPASFLGVYGFEWYVRRGPEGPLDPLRF